MVKKKGLTSYLYFRRWFEHPGHVRDKYWHAVNKKQKSQNFCEKIRLKAVCIPGGKKLNKQNDGFNSYEMLKENERNARIVKILSEGIYEYLKANGRLKSNQHRQEKINSLLEKNRKILEPDYSIENEADIAWLIKIWV